MGSPAEVCSQSTLRMSFFISNARRGPKEEARYRREIRKMFDKADKDGDGKLTKDEWFNVLNSSGCDTSLGEVSELFDRMDRDFDGRLSFGEFMGEETPLEKVFKNMDKDGDGSVSKEVSHLRSVDFGSTYS